MKEFSESEINEIHEVLHGQISDSKREDFFNRMEKSPELREEFEFWKKIEEAGRYNLYKKSAENALEKVIDEELVSATPFIKFFKNSQTLAIAASVIVLLTAGIGFWYVNNSKNDTILSNNHPPIDSTNVEDPIKNPVTNLSTEELLANNLRFAIENVPDKFSNAVNEINNGNEENGIKDLLALGQPPKTIENQPPSDEPLFGSSGDKSVENPTAAAKLNKEEKSYQQLYLGIAYLKKGNYDKAIIAFGNVENNTAKLEADWYKTLAYLGKNNTEKTIELAKQVASDETNPHSGAASLLIEELKK